MFGLLKVIAYRVRSIIDFLILHFFIFVGFSSIVISQSDPNSGLWIGEALVSQVSEVSVPLDENNVPRAPDPNVPTAAHDLASLRLIVHVDAFGKARFLKDVAIVKSSRVSTDLELDQGVALVTDPSLYSNYSGQPGQRYAAAAFDFGDQKASLVLDKLMEAAISAAVAKANDTSNVSDSTLKNVANTEALTAANIILTRADLNKAFNDYVSSNILSTDLTSKLNASGVFGTPNLPQKDSPYNDLRAIEMVSSLNAILTGGLTSEQKSKELNNTAASFIDSDNEYNRFIEGGYFSEMILAAAAKVASEKIADNTKTRENYLTALNTVEKINDAKEEALKIKITNYGYTDTRGEDAINEVLDDIINKAISSNLTTVNSIKNELISEGVRSLANDVKRYPSPSTSPSAEYNLFIASSEFTGAAVKAAEAASIAVYNERVGSSFPSQVSYSNAAKIAVANELKSAVSAAARANVSELIMDGSVDGNTLSLTFKLPASHPTNPFRHRRNPDHTTGRDITRILKLTKLSIENNKLTGAYDEEIIGLHKLLGPNKDIGLKVRGSFELNRVSNVATLNGN